MKGNKPLTKTKMMGSAVTKVQYLVLCLLTFGMASAAHLLPGPENHTPDTSPEFVRIGDQLWAARNLALRNYRNGDPIPQAASEEDFWDYSVRGEGAWCYPQGNPENEAIYGLLYNWYAIADERGLAPDGWHVPTDAEWEELVQTLGPDSAGLRLKAIEGWPKGGAGTNESGFNAVAAGFRWHTGSFEGKDIYGSWWTATEHSEDDYFAWFRGVGADYEHVYRDSSSKYFGFSIRLLKDSP